MNSFLSFESKENFYLLLEGRPRFPLLGGVDELDEKESVSVIDDGSQAEHCHDPSGITSRPTQYV